MASSSTTPPQVKPGPSLMTLVEASSRRRTDTSDATTRTRSARISVGHGASNLSSVGEDEQGRDNHARVKKVNDWLKDRFIETWFDEENFLPADPNIVRRMPSGIDHAKCVVVFVTKRWRCRNSKWRSRARLARWRR